MSMLPPGSSNERVSLVRRRTDTHLPRNSIDAQSMSSIASASSWSTSSDVTDAKIEFSPAAGTADRMQPEMPIGEIAGLSFERPKDYARLSQLQAEMTSNEEQIQRLHDAQRAVHQAVTSVLGSGTSPYPFKAAGFFGNNGAPRQSSELCIPDRVRSDEQRGSLASRFSRLFKPLPDEPKQFDHHEEYKQQNPWLVQPEPKQNYTMGAPLPHRVRFNKSQGLDEEAYLRQNPWIGKPRARPNYSMGGPLPRRVRYNKQPPSPPAPAKIKVGGDWTHDPEKGGVEHAEKSPRHSTGEVGDESENHDKLRNWWARVRAKHPEPCSEILATSVTIFIGISTTLAANLSKGQSTVYGTYETICWAWALAYMLGIYIGGGVSGAHMNPVVSISLAIFRGFPWKQCSIYVLCQLLGAAFAALAAFYLHHDAIIYSDPDFLSSYNNFFSKPKPWVSMSTGFMNQFLIGVGTGIATLALGDDQNNPPGVGLGAFIHGLVEGALKMCLGYNANASLNPASDFAARVICTAVGYRAQDTFYKTWWLQSQAATLLGAFAGCLLYDVFIFTGSESPINYRIPDKYRGNMKIRYRKYWKRMFA